MRREDTRPPDHAHYSMRLPFLPRRAVIRARISATGALLAILDAFAEGRDRESVRGLEAWLDSIRPDRVPWRQGQLEGTPCSKRQASCRPNSGTL